MIDVEVGPAQPGGLGHPAEYRMRAASLQLLVRAAMLSSKRLELRDVVREVRWSGASHFLIDFRPVGIPAGHGSGAYNAIHLTIVRCSTPVAWLTDLSPVTMRKESQRWQTIWWADIRPQRPWLSGRTVPQSQQELGLVAGSSQGFHVVSLLGAGQARQARS